MCCVHGIFFCAASASENVFCCRDTPKHRHFWCERYSRSTPFSFVCRLRFSHCPLWSLYFVFLFSFFSSLRTFHDHLMEHPIYSVESQNATTCGCELLNGAMGVSPRSACLIGWVMLSFTPDHPDCWGRACCLARCFLPSFITSARLTQPFFTFDGQACDSAVSRSTLGIAPPKALVSHRVPFCTPCCCVPSPLHAQVSCLNRRSSGKSTQRHL